MEAILEVDLGRGWKAERLTTSEGPIVLIALKSCTGECSKARLDIEKGMFLDPPFLKPEQSRMQTLLEEIRSISR